MNNKIVKKCLYCGKIIKKGKYCSNECQHLFEYHDYIDRWLKGEENGTIGTQQISKKIRRYLLEINNSHCCRCGWGEVNPFTGLTPQEIHHIDNDPNNNSFSNLEQLCPNCHSLTSGWKGANKINASKRAYRRQ